MFTAALSVITQKKLEITQMGILLSNKKERSTNTVDGTPLMNLKFIMLSEKGSPRMIPLM